MQPQDQNYQSNDQTNQPITGNDQDINSEQLESAPTQEDNSSQPPATPFVDGSQDDDIPDVPMITTEPTLNNQPEMEHLSEPPTQPINDEVVVTNEESNTTPSEAGTNDEQISSQEQNLDESVLESLSSDPLPIEPERVEQMSYESSDNVEQDEQSAIPSEETSFNEASAGMEEPQPAPQFSEPPATNTQIAASEPLNDAGGSINTAPQSETPVPENASGENIPAEPLSSIDLEPTPPPIPETETPAEASVEAQSPPPTERVSLTDHSSFAPQEPKAITNDTVATPEEKENIYTEICSEIIKEQEQIIGTLAVEQANYVEGLTVDPVSYHCTVTGDGSKVIDDLIEQYRDFFGHAAVEVCKEAASRFLARLPAEELPTSLR